MLLQEIFSPRETTEMVMHAVVKKLKHEPQDFYMKPSDRAPSSKRPSQEDYFFHITYKSGKREFFYFNVKVVNTSRGLKLSVTRVVDNEFFADTERPATIDELVKHIDEWYKLTTEPF